MLRLAGVGMGVCRGEPLGPPGGVGRLGKARRRAAASGGVQNGGAKDWMDPCGAKDQERQE